MQAAEDTEANPGARKHASVPPARWLPHAHMLAPDMLTWHLGTAGFGKCAQALLRSVQARLLGPYSAGLRRIAARKHASSPRLLLYPASLARPCGQAI